MSKFIVTDMIYRALYEGGVISAEPSSVRRCVIDLERGSVAKVYLEAFADDTLIDVALEGGLRVLRVVPDEKGRPTPPTITEAARPPEGA